MDPDEAELSPEPPETDLAFDPEPASTHPDQVDFDLYGFEVTSSQMARDSDPYGFKLSPEEENQEVIDLCPSDSNKQQRPTHYSNQEVLKPHAPENQEVLASCSLSSQKLLDLCNNGNQEVLEPSSLDNWGLVSSDDKEIPDSCCHNNQEVLEPFHNIATREPLEPCTCDNQQVLEPCDHGNLELLDLSHPENQGDLELDSHGNQEQLDFSRKENQEEQDSGSHGNQEVLDLRCNENPILGSHDNQEVLDLFSGRVFPEANNNQCVVEPEHDASPTNSSDSDVTSDDLRGLELSNTAICITNKAITNTADTHNTTVKHPPTGQNFVTYNSPASQHLLDGDLGSVFGAGGYVGCPDVADDLEPLERRQPKPIAEPVRPVRPVRPPRPSLKVQCHSSLLFRSLSMQFVSPPRQQHLNVFTMK